MLLFMPKFSPGVLLPWLPFPNWQPADIRSLFSIAGRISMEVECSLGSLLWEQLGWCANIPFGGFRGQKNGFPGGLWNPFTSITSPAQKVDSSLCPHSGQPLRGHAEMLPGFTCHNKPPLTQSLGSPSALCGGVYPWGWLHKVLREEVKHRGL